MIEWVLGHLPGFLAVLAAFGFIIFIHELGHFLMARRVGIRCPNFAIGFGPKLFGFTWRGTEFSVRLLPFGGYVQMLGEDPAADESAQHFRPVGAYVDDSLFPAPRDAIVAALEARLPDTTEPAERRHLESVIEHVRWSPDRVYESVKDAEGNFNDRTIPQRAAVVVGGVAMNFVSALLLFWIVGAAYGLVDLSTDSTARVMKVFAGSPAEAAGLKYGDEVTAVNGVPVLSGKDMIEAIEAFPGQPIRLTVQRSGQDVQVDIVPNVQVGGMTFHPEHTRDGLPQVVDVDSFGQVAGPASEAGLKAGDVVVAVNGQPVNSVAELVERFRALAGQAEASGSREVAVALGLQGSERPVELELPASQVAPDGKIGIMPGLVTEFVFIGDTTREVAAVRSGSPAAEAGLRPGDEIFEANGRAVRDEASLDAVLEDLAHKNELAGPGQAERLSLDILRDGGHVALSLPAPAGGSTDLGIEFRPVTFGAVVAHSFWLLGRLIVAPVTIIFMLVQKALNPSLVTAGLSGPIGIMQMIFELSDQGLGKFLYIVALINAAVGAFNLIPFPALDGSRLLILGIGAVRRREVDYSLEARIHYVGLVVLLAVVLLVTVLDVQRLIAGMPLTK